MKRYAMNRKSGGFAIWTCDEDQIADIVRVQTVDYKEGDEWIQDGLVTPDGDITDEGWEVLNQDVGRLERNLVAWLRRVFENARDEGHGGHGGDEFIGIFWFDADDPKQVELIRSFAAREPIREDPLSYEENMTVFEGLSDVGASSIDFEIEFFDIDE